VSVLVGRTGCHGRDSDATSGVKGDAGSTGGFPLMRVKVRGLPAKLVSQEDAAQERAHKKARGVGWGKR